LDACRLTNAVVRLKAWAHASAHTERTRNAHRMRTEHPTNIQRANKAHKEHTFNKG